MSEKVSQLASLADNSITKAAEAEESNYKLQGLVEDLTLEKDTFLQQCQDLEALTKGHKSNVLASRLISLSDDVRINKLASLKQRRQVQILRQEKKHLQNVIASMETDVEGLEEGKVLAETKNLLGDIAEEESIMKDNNNNDTSMSDYKRLNANFLNLSENEPSHDVRRTSAVQFASPDNKENDVRSSNLSFGEGALTSDELLVKMQNLAEELNISRRDSSSNRLKLDQTQSQIFELQSQLRERDNELKRYEEQSDGGRYDVKHNSEKSGKQFRIMRDEQDKLQGNNYNIIYILYNTIYIM
jgi:hypothetical protein